MTNRDFKAEFISHFQNCPNDPVWSSGLQKVYSSKNARIHKWIIDTACLILEFYNPIPSNSLPSERCDNVTSMFYETQHAIAQNEAFWLVAFISGVKAVQTTLAGPRFLNQIIG